MDYTVDGLQVEMSAPNENAVNVYAQALINSVEEEGKADA